MSFHSLSGTSFQSVFKAEIILDACVKWGEMLCSSLSGNRVKGPDDWRVDGWEGSCYRRELSTEQELRSSLAAWKNQARVSGEHAPCAGV